MYANSWQKCSGRWVRYVRFKISLNMGVEDFDIICYEDDNSENSSLPKEAHVEPFVFLAMSLS